MNVSGKLYVRLVRYFEQYTGDARIRHKHFTDGKIKGVGISDPQISLQDYYDDNELRFNFLEVSSRKKVGKNLLSASVFDEVKPDSFEDKIKCLGFSHENGTWNGNAKDLFKRGDVSFKDLIAHQEDVYELLMRHGVDEKESYIISEDIKHGMVRRRGWDPGVLNTLHRCHVPDWFIESCEHIYYLFPRAHDMMLIKHYVK